MVFAKDVLINKKKWLKLLKLENKFNYLFLKSLNSKSADLLLKTGCFSKNWTIMLFIDLTLKIKLNNVRFN